MVFDDDRLGCAGRDRFQMGCGIASHMAILWHDHLERLSVEPHQHVVLNVRVGVFVYGDPRCRMWRVYNGDPLLSIPASFTRSRTRSVMSIISSRLSSESPTDRAFLSSSVSVTGFYKLISIGFYELIFGPRFYYYIRKRERHKMAPFL